MPSKLTHAAARNAILVVVDVIAKSPGIGELELVAVLEREGLSIFTRKSSAFLFLPPLRGPFSSEWVCNPSPTTTWPLIGSEAKPSYR